MAQALRVEIIGDPRSYSKALQTATGHTNTFGKSLLSLGKVAAFSLGAAGVGGAFVVLKRGFSELAESQKVMAQTEAVLTSTGQAAKVSSEDVSALATSLSQLTGADDEAIQAGENMLLTFTNIRNETGKGNDIFNQATAATLDMATAMNQGATPSAEALAKQSILVGKALNDPIRGMTALRRVGVSFTESQIETIKALVKSGHMMEAQRLILAELRKEFGGSAKAAGETLPGQLNKLRNSFDELAGGVAAAFLPAISKATGALTDLFEKIAAAGGIRAKIKVVADFVITTAGGAVAGIRKQISDLLFGSFVKGGAGGVGPEGIRFQKGLIDQMNTWLAGADWKSVGINIGLNIRKFADFSAALGKDLTRELGEAARSIDWTQFALGLAQGLLGSSLSDKLKNVLLLNWKLTNPIGLAVGTGIGKKVFEGLSGAVGGPGGNGSAVSERLKTALFNAQKAAAGVATIEGGKIGANMAKGLIAQFNASINALAAAAVAQVGAIFNQISVAAQNAMKGSPKYFTYYLGKDLIKQLLEGMNEETKAPALKGLNEVGRMIVAAAKKYGVDARAALAVAMGEGGVKFGAVGDKGTSFGPFQQHIGGRNPYGDPAQAAAFSNSIRGIEAALKGMADEGARGKTGLEAIRIIIEKYEEPLEKLRAGNIAAAFEAYKKLPAQITEGGKKSGEALKKMLTDLAGLVKEYGPKIGAEHARSIIAGLVGKTGDIVAAAKAQMEKVVQAMAAVVQSRTDLKSAFRQLATDALAAFDAVAAAWKPPALVALEKMQLEDQINAAVKGVADAQSAIDAAIAAQAALAPKEGETPEEFAARQAEAEANVRKAVEDLGVAQRAYTELQLQLTANQQQIAHDKQMAADREHLAAQLLLLQTELAKHPEEYAKINKRIIALMKKYHIPMHEAGRLLASKFADGMVEGIQSVIDAARRLANALEDIPGVGSQGGGSGATNPGTAIGGGHGAGVAFRSTAAASGVTVNVYGDVTGEEVVRKVRTALQRTGLNNASNPVAAF